MLKKMLLLFVCFGLISCSPAGEGPVDLAPPEVDMVWPPPPATARIRYLYSFNKPEDLGARPSFFEGLWRLFAGQQRQTMIRPYAVAVEGAMLAVADPGAGAVHVFDRGKRSYKRIDRAGKTHLLSPVGVALHGQSVYVSDSALGKVYEFDLKGQVLSEFTELERPTGLVIDGESGRLFVSDTLMHDIAVLDPDGTIVKRFGGRGEGTAQFNYPTHLTIAEGKLFVNDTMNFRIQVFSLDGVLQNSFGKQGASSGNFSQPKGVAVDSAGHVYVADSVVNRLQIFDQQGRFLLAIGGTGATPGEFSLPAGITIVDDRIYVADSYNRRVQVFEYLGGDGS